MYTAQRLHLWNFGQICTYDRNELLGVFCELYKEKWLQFTDTVLFR